MIALPIISIISLPISSAEVALATQSSERAGKGTAKEIYGPTHGLALIGAPEPMRGFVQIRDRAQWPTKDNRVECRKEA